MLFPYSQLMSNHGWIAGLVPCEEDSQENFDFYGPNVLNIRIFTGPRAKGYYDPGEVSSHPHVQRLSRTFDTFDHYKTFVLLDTAIRDDSNKDDFEVFDNELKGICEALANLGFQYLGTVDSTQIDVSVYLSGIINSYFDAQREE